MMRWLLNVWLLSGKELRSLLRDIALMVIVVFFLRYRSIPLRKV